MIAVQIILLMSQLVRFIDGGWIITSGVSYQNKVAEQKHTIKAWDKNAKKNKLLDDSYLLCLKEIVDSNHITTWMSWRFYSG